MASGVSTATNENVTDGRQQFEADTDNHVDHPRKKLRSGPSIVQTLPENGSVDNNNKSSSKKFSKTTGPFSVQDLCYLLKTSSSLRAQIFPSSSSSSINPHSDEDGFTIKSISTGYVNHAFVCKVNEKYSKKDSRNEFFIKINKNKHAKQMFDAEANGLHALREVCTDLIRVPEPLATGCLSEHDDNEGAWFLSEFITMANTAKKRSHNQLCQFAPLLAKMHQISAENHSRSSRSGQFGFDFNNFYIHTEQDNTWQNDWCTFFVEQRLVPVVQRMKHDPHLIGDHGKNMELILLCDRLIPHVPWFLASNRVQIQPCLLHGDLSNQNWSLDTQGQIVIFDGSPFYGPYEVDIYTMQEGFIQAYFNAMGGPIEGYEMRFELYNLLRLLRCITDTELDLWRPLAFQCLSKLLIHCGAWTSSLVRFPCGVKIPTDKIKLPSSSTGKKNVVLVYGGSFCPVHLGHLEVMDLVAETLQKPEYDFEILGGYFCPSPESWIKKKLPEDYLPNAYRESLLLLATADTHWMINRSYGRVNMISDNIIEAIRSVYGPNFAFTVVHICGIDAIKANEKRVPTKYPLVVVDRSGYNDNDIWNTYLEETSAKNRKRLIWISPWTGEVRSSTKVRRLLAKYNDDNVTDVRPTLQDLIPLPCIDYIFEYNLRKWFKTSEVA